MKPTIREYRPDADYAALRECVVELQEAERALEPFLPPGEEIVENYLRFLFERCMETDGTVFVAEVNERVAGFVSVFARVRSHEPDDPDEFAFVADVLVLPPYRRKGVASELVQRAERFARDAGARIVRVALLARNREGHEMYRRLGYSDYQLQLAKRLDT